MVREARIAWDGPGRLESLVREETELPDGFQELEAPPQTGARQRRSPMTASVTVRAPICPAAEGGSVQHPPAA